MSGLPAGSVIGVIGGGQLARMIALEARRFGFEIAVLDPEGDCPAAQIAEHWVEGALNDLEAAKRLAEISDVITLDTEHVDAALLNSLEAITPVRPSAQVLGTIQDRWTQRQFLSENGLPQPVYHSIRDEDECADVAEKMPGGGVLKTRRFGYDGRGQARAASGDEIGSAWARLERAPVVIEEWIDFEREISVVLARGLDGHIELYPVVENRHERHILKTSHAPAQIAASLSREAERLAARIAEALDAFGVVAVEMFVTRDQKLLINEIAPRVHNSGHFTLGACVTSQFEQHLRGISGLPLGDPSLLRPAVLFNLLGDLWKSGEPDWTRVLAHKEARLHLYGKKQPFPGRKMGHVLLLDEDLSRAEANAESILEALGHYQALEPESGPAPLRK
ncbi:MAG: 5-(carboxyamino)imidazole ribonucleotide synthase [Planctomycetota bacterium]